MGSSIDRRDFLRAAGCTALAPPAFMSRFRAPHPALSSGCGQDAEYLPVSLDTVPFPEDIAFTVRSPDDHPLTLRAHYWYNADARRANTKCPAIVEFNPYRRRDGTLYADSMMYPWFARNGYLCFRVDLQGSGDSEGTLTDEYSEEELAYCAQVIEQIARLPCCDGNVGMMGKSWSAINSLMVAARKDCPAAGPRLLPGAPPTGRPSSHPPGQLRRRPDRSREVERLENLHDLPVRLGPGVPPDSDG